jgi:hypothetical protein
MMTAAGCCPPHLEQLLLMAAASGSAVSPWRDVCAGLQAAAQAARGAPRSQEQRRWLLQRESALATRPCAHLGCTNMAGSSEAELKGLLCVGCMTVRYCCAQCARADWAQHKPACKLLAAERAAGSGS